MKTLDIQVTTIAKTTSWCPEAGSHKLLHICKEGVVSYQVVSEHGFWGEELFEGTLKECVKEFQDKVEIVEKSYREFEA